MTGRTWVIAPDAESLRKRWKRLRDEPDAEVKAKLFHPHEGGDRTINKVVGEALSGHPHPASSVAADKGGGVEPTRYSFRSFDRQWLVPDNRLINRANPQLWKTASDNQVYLTALMAHSPASGPARWPGSSLIFTTTRAPSAAERFRFGRISPVLIRICRLHC